MIDQAENGGSYIIFTIVSLNLRFDTLLLSQILTEIKLA